MSSTRNSSTILDTDDILLGVNPNIESWPFLGKGRDDATAIIGCKSVNRYITVPNQHVPVLLAAISLMDGQHSVRFIETRVRQEFSIFLDARHLHGKLISAGLLASSRTGIRENGDISRNSLHLFELNLGRWLAPLTNAFQIAFPILVIGAVVLGVIDVSGHSLDLVRDNVTYHDSLQTIRGTPRLTYLLGVCLMIISGLLHELGHTLMAARYGLPTTKLKVSLYLGFIPLVFVRIPGIYTLSPTRRVLVWGGGMMANGMIVLLLLASSPFLHLTAFTEPLFRVSLAANLAMLVFNWFPLLPTDGYYILSTLVGIPNIRTAGWRLLCGKLPQGGPRRFSVVVLYTLGTLGLLGYAIVNQGMHITHSVRTGQPFLRMLLFLLWMIGALAITGWKEYRSS